MGVGDDLTVTNITRVQRAIDERSCNALLLKVNQIGSVTESIDAVKLCKQNGWGVRISPSPILQLAFAPVKSKQALLADQSVTPSTINSCALKRNLVVLPSTLAQIGANQHGWGSEQTRKHVQTF